MEPNAFLISLIEHSPYSMWISDDKGTLIRLNQACRDLFYIQDDEVVGKYNIFWDGLMEAQGLLPIIKQVFENGKTTRFCSEYDTSRVKNFDLKERVSLVLDVTIIPVFDGRGRVTHAIIQHIDITESKRAEELLRESENRYRSIFETTGTATIIVEEDMTITLANAELEKLTGYSRAEIEGKKKWTEFVAKEDLEAMKAYHFARRNAPGSAPRSYEFRLLDRQGTVKNVLLTVALVAGTKKTVASILDITERKQAEEALRKSEKEYRSVIENIQDVFYRSDINGRLIMGSPSGAEMFGYDLIEEVIGQPLESFWADPKDRGFLLARMKAAGGVKDFETVLKRKNGATFHASLTAHFYHDDQGNLLGTEGIIRDVTERKRAEEALRESEERWQFALEGAGDGVWDWNPQTNKVHFSRQWKAMLGYEESEIGDTLDEWAKCVHPDDYQGAIAEIDKHFKGESPVYTSEHRLLCKGGGYKWILDRGKVIRWTDEGKPLRVIGTHTDITVRKDSENALRESEERYRHVVELSPELIAIHSNEKYVYMNPAGVKFLGAKGPEELIGRSIFDIIHPDYWGIVKERMKKTYKEGKEVPLIEERYVRLDGRMIDVEVASASLNYQGQPAALVIARDITKRKRAEDALRRNEKEAQDLLQETIIMAEIGKIISSTLDIGEVYDRFAAEVKKLVPFDRISINEVNVSEEEGVTVYTAGLKVPTRRAGDIYPLAGSASGEMLRSRSSLLVHGEAMKEFVMRTPSYLPSYQAGIRSLVATPLVSRDRIVGTLLLSSIRPDAYSQQNLKLVEKIGNQIAGAIANIQLFREYRRTWGDLRQSEERYRRLVENSPLGIISVDLKGTITHANTQMASILGFSSPSATLGISIYSFSPLMESGVSAKFRLCEESGESGVLEGAYRGKEGEETYLRYHFTPIRDSEQKITGVQAIVEDVSERKHLEDQLAQAQKMEAIGTLAGGIAHDFNNILSAIMGYSEIAGLDMPENSKAKYNLEQSMKASHRAKNLVQQILAFSRQGKQERRPMDIRPIIKEGLKLLRASLPSTIEIRQKIETDLGSIVADPTQIHQVLMNLCTNAGHAMSEKGGILEVSLGNMNMDEGAAAISAGIEAGPYLRLRVSDTGHGIHPQILKRIFDPYFTTKEAGKGTGLGLAVVHGIVKSYGGGIVVSSEVGKGSAFDVYFPRIDAVKASLGTERAEPLPLGGQERVLFVDDEETIAEIGQKLLKYLGYRVVVRTSSLEALELFRTKTDEFDLVITDMTMPNMTGEKFAQEVLKIRREIPVILCTGFSEQITEEKAKAMGIREFVMKPLVIMDLAKAMRRALDPRKKTRGRE